MPTAPESPAIIALYPSGSWIRDSEAVLRSSSALACCQPEKKKTSMNISRTLAMHTRGGRARMRPLCNVVSIYNYISILT